MNVGIDELDRLIRRYVSTGAAVVIVILGPGQTTDPGGTSSTTAAPVTITVQPAPPTGEAAPADAPTTVTATITPTATPTPRSVPPGSLPPGSLPPGTLPPTGSSSTRTTSRPTPDEEPSDSPSASRTGETATGSATAEPVPGAGTTAAQALGWGTPARADEFDAGTAGWQLYEGVGHDGKGRRSPGAVTVQNGVLTITGDAAGTTGGMAWGGGRRYGRWEARVRAPAADPSYDAVLLLWPDADDAPQGGEIDVMEAVDPGRRSVDGVVHHGSDNQQVAGSVTTDATQWHNWAVEWTPTSIAMFLDGREWYRTTDPAVQPPRPMHLCVQLDWFPTSEGAVQQSSMQVDWVREYDLGGNAPANGG